MKPPLPKVAIMNRNNNNNNKQTIKETNEHHKTDACCKFIVYLEFIVYNLHTLHSLAIEPGCTTLESICRKFLTYLLLLTYQMHPCTVAYTISKPLISYFYLFQFRNLHLLSIMTGKKQGCRKRTFGKKYCF